MYTILAIYVPDIFSLWKFYVQRSWVRFMSTIICYVGLLSLASNYYHNAFSMNNHEYFLMQLLHPIVSPLSEIPCNYSFILVVLSIIAYRYNIYIRSYLIFKFSKTNTASFDRLRLDRHSFQDTWDNTEMNKFRARVENEEVKKPS